MFYLLWKGFIIMNAFYFFHPFKELLMVLLVSTHIKWHVLVPSQYLKNTKGIDLDSNLFLFASGMCAYCFTTKYSQMRYIGLSKGPNFLQGFWIKNFFWALTLNVNCHVHHPHPNSKSIPYAWIMFLVYSTMVLLACFATPFCCGVYEALVCH
jgi:hypothetical protein